MAGSRRSGPLPCITLLGEFSAGKSSIINLLIGCDMLPTAVLSSTRWPTFVCYTPELRISAISDSGEHREVSPDAVKTLTRSDIRRINIGMPNELLRHVELIDTPGFADPFHDPERTLEVIESADICVWCTLANQAWRRSERRIWLSLPARLRSGGILIVTHVDTLARRDERLQIRARLEREAGDLFEDIVLLAVPDAIRAVHADGRIIDADLWQSSGGSALVAALRKAAMNHYRKRGENVAVAQSGAAWWTGFPQVDSAASAAATAVTPAPTPEISDIRPSAIELQGFLASVMDTVPACHAAAWIDLDGRKVLQIRMRDTGEIFETTVLGQAIADLFQGSNVQRIERLFKRARNKAQDKGHYFQEIIVIADDCVGIFLRHRSRLGRSLAVVSDRTANLGMVLARTRRLLETTDSSI